MRFYHPVSSKISADPTFRATLRYPENAGKAAKAKIGEDIKKDFFKILLTHPSDVWAVLPVAETLGTLTSDRPLRRWGGSIPYYGALLCFLGFLLALRGCFLFFKKAPYSQEALVQGALLLHIIGYSCVHILSLMPSYLVHVVFLFGLLGWWAVVDWINLWRTKRRIGAFAS
jgi:hypothetical protein